MHLGVACQKLMMDDERICIGLGRYIEQNKKRIIFFFDLQYVYDLFSPKKRFMYG